MRKSDDDWYRFCTIALEWLHPKRDLDPEPWVEEVVERAQSLNIDTLAFDFYHGGYTIFNDGVAPKDRHVGDADLLALLDRELHARDMRLVAMNMGSHCASYMAGEYPDWRAVDKNGNTMPFFPAHHMCINSPYGNFLLQELTEFLPRYQIDGLYIEGLYGLDCYCDYCCTEFEETYGYPLPVTDRSAGLAAAIETKDAGGSGPYMDFRAGVLTDFLRRLRKVIDEQSPDTVLLPSPSLFENVYADFNAWGSYADAITLERQWGYQRGELVCRANLFEIGLSLQVVRAESGRQPFGTTWLGWGVDRDYAPSTSEHYRLNFAEILLYGGTPQLHAQTIFENDQSEMSTVAEMFDLVRQVRPTMRDAHMVPYAALVVDWSEYKASDHFKGFYRALIENHVPFEVVSKRDLLSDRLEPYAVLLLPNVVRLSDEEAAAVEAFNAAGGGLVMTYQTGCADDDGVPREENPLFELAGVKGPYGVATHPSGTDQHHMAAHYYKVEEAHPVGSGTAGRLQSFRGSYAEVEPTTGRTIARALDYDYSKMHRHHPVMGWYPGHSVDPLIVVNEGKDRGRVVYFAAEFDRVTYDSGLPGVINTLAEATVWSAEEPAPVEVETSPTVEVATHYSPEARAYTILMVNQTTNDLRPGIVVRHVEPVRDTTISLNDLDGQVKNVRAVTGATVEWEDAEGTCTLRLPDLNEYEALVITLK